MRTHQPRRRLLHALATALAAALLCLLPTTLAAASPPANGIDVSHYQASVQWSAVPSSVTFAGMKATENCRTDSTFARNWQGARSTGRAFRVAYVFLHQGQDPAAVVKCLKSAILSAGGPLQAGEGVALDVEASPTISVAYTLSVAVQVQVQLNRFPIIYAGCFYGSIMTAKSLAGYAHWIAAYRSTAPCPYDLWQFASNGAVSGVPHAVDVNTYNAASAFYALVRSTRDAIADDKSTFATLQPDDQVQVADVTAFYRAVQANIDAFYRAVQLRQFYTALQARDMLLRPTVAKVRASEIAAGLSAYVPYTRTVLTPTQRFQIAGLELRAAGIS